MRHPVLATLTAAVVGAFSGSAVAQSPPIETASASSGEKIRLGYYATFKQKVCAAGIVPIIDVVSPQSIKGQLVVSTGVMTTKRILGCPAISAPARVIFYQSKPGFVGEETIAFLVRDPASGQSQRHVFKITVRGSI